MTLVLTCISSEFAMVVSDTLVSSNGNVVSDKRMKLTIFDGQVIIGYAGLAELQASPGARKRGYNRGRVMRTDEWLVNILTDKMRDGGQLGPVIAAEATTEWSRQPYRRSSKGTAFIGAGFGVNQSGNAGPFLQLISNCVDRNFAWQANVSDSFSTWTVSYDPTLQNSLVRSIGQSLRDTEMRRLQDDVKTVFATDPTNGKDVLFLLTRAVRVASHSNSAIGGDVVAVVLPRKVLGAQAVIGGKDSRHIFEQEVSAFFYPQDSDNPVSLTPNLVVPGKVSMMAMQESSQPFTDPP